MFKLFSILVFILFSCQTENSTIEEFQESKVTEQQANASLVDSIQPIAYPWLVEKEISSEHLLGNRIPPPSGYKREKVDTASFGFWLRRLPLKPSNSSVYLYNKTLKGNQDVHHAVIDIDIGERDLQQCADAVMRLRAEYLYWRNNYDAIHFNYTNGERVDFNQWIKGEKPVVKNNHVQWNPCTNCNSSHESFRNYMNAIYMYAGTASLSKELQTIKLSDLEIGDVFIQGGFPGHAVLVVDVCVNSLGNKAFLLSQSYMPAQDIHILKNPTNDSFSPWYSMKEIDQEINTPEWYFNKDDLKRFY